MQLCQLHSTNIYDSNNEMISNIPFFVLIFVTSRFLPALFALIRHSMKRGYGFPLSLTTYCNRLLLSSFPTKTFPLNPVLQIDAIIF